MTDSMIQRFRRWLSPLKYTALHPQWLSYRNKLLFDWLSNIEASSGVLDIGCFDRWATNYLPKDCDYVGLDYVQNNVPFYASDVDVIGDGHSLPFKDCSFEVVLLLDVFEHLAFPERAIQEINRVLVENGLLIIQVPFMYPVHDAPNDYSRMTEYGLKHMFELNGLSVEKAFSRGSPIETSSLLMNIALSSTLVSTLEKSKVVGFVCSLLLVPVIVLSNVFGWMDSLLGRPHSLMPFSYQFILRKNDSV